MSGAGRQEEDRNASATIAATATSERCRNVRLNMKGAPICQSLRSTASRSFRNAPAANLNNAMFYMNDHSVRKGGPVTTGIRGQFLPHGASSCDLFCEVYSDSSGRRCSPVAPLILLLMIAKLQAVELHPPRLLLRPLQLSDAEQTQLLFPHWEIVKHLNTIVPWPYP